jgi:rhamnosyl/mannosyltransferase
MRILHFYKTSYPQTFGGTEQVIHQLGQGLSKADILTDVLALAPHLKSLKTYRFGSRYTVYHMPRQLHIASTSLSFGACSIFRKLAKKADLIHYHFPWPFMDLVHFAMRIKKPCVLTYHSDIVKQKHLLKIYAPLQNHFLKGMDRIIATSPHYAQSSPVLQKHSDRLAIIPLGLDQNTYPTPSSQRMGFWREKIRAQQISNSRNAALKEPRFFLFIGQPRYYKGLHILLEALKKSGFPTVIVGADSTDLSRLSLTPELQPAYLMSLGKIADEDKVALLQLCYGVVLPSHLRSEAFGLALLEGAMYKKPLVCCDIGTGTTFINDHGNTGLVVPPCDPDRLHEALDYLWNHPEHACQMGEQAYRRYLAHFTGDQMVDAYRNLYEEVLGK